MRLARDIYAAWSQLVSTGRIPPAACAEWACDLHASVAASLAKAEPGFSCILDVTCDLAPALMLAYHLRGPGLPADASPEDQTGVAAVFDSVQRVLDWLPPPEEQDPFDTAANLLAPTIDAESLVVLALYLVGFPEVALPYDLDKSRALSLGTVRIGVAEDSAAPGSRQGSLGVGELLVPVGCEVALTLDTPWFGWTKHSFSLVLRYNYGQRLFVVSIYDTTDPESSRDRCPDTTIDISLSIDSARYEALPLDLANFPMGTNRARFVFDVTQESPYVNSFYTGEPGRDIVVRRAWEHGLYSISSSGLPIIWVPATTTSSSVTTGT